MPRSTDSLNNCLRSVSRADEHLTQTLKAALSLVNVRVLDHLVIASNNALSFAETGLL